MAASYYFKVDCPQMTQINTDEHISFYSWLRVQPVFTDFLLIWVYLCHLWVVLLSSSHPTLNRLR